MKCEKKLKRFIAIRRKHNGKKNGVIANLWIDWPCGEKAMATNKNRYKRNKNRVSPNYIIIK